MESEDILLTVEQVATMAHLRPTTIRSKINQGLLRAYKPPRGKNWLIRRSDAEGMLTGSQASPALAPSPLIDRLGTPEGRARAVAVISQLGEDWDAGEQRDAWEKLRPNLEISRVQMRRWDPETGEKRDGDS